MKVQMAIQLFMILSNSENQVIQRTNIVQALARCR